MSSFTDRAVIVRALDIMLRVQADVQAIRAGFRLELDDVQARLHAIERGMGLPPTAFPKPPRKPEFEEEEEGSIHEWDKILRSAGKELSKKVKDPHSPLDSERARAIAEEVVRHARERAELSTWRRLKGLLPMLGKETLKALVPFIAGGLVWELLRILAKVR